jgi:hypothetical protein
MAMQAHTHYPFVAALALLAAGCAGTTPEWDSRFGLSVRTDHAQQVRNPAPATQAPDGLDGKAAGAAMARYRQVAPRQSADGQGEPR